MLPRLGAETHPPPLVPPSLLAQSLSPKDIAGSLTSLMKVSFSVSDSTLASICYTLFYMG